MTFSDAEEDHPTNSRTTSRPAPRRGESTDSGQQDSTTSHSRTESGLSNVSSTSPTVEHSVSAVTPTTTSIRSTLSSATSSRISSHAASSISPAAAEAVTASNSANHLLSSDQMVDSEKLVEKLKQIQGYITQTSAAMEALELEGDMSKINQYNTLVKVLRDLKSSEDNLKKHIDNRQNDSEQVENIRNAASEGQVPVVSEPNGRPVSQQSTARIDSSSALNTSSSNLIHNSVENVVSSDASSTSSKNVDGTKPNRHLSMNERLTRSQAESELITAKMRETIEKREELMSRYKATRERLVNLKKQRRDLLQDERRILHHSSGGSIETPYEDPIPGAETWTLDQLNKSIEDFRGLYDKIDRLQTAYTTKAEAIDPNDETEKTEVANKLEQLVLKRRQLIDAITQLKGLQRARRAEQGLPELDEDDQANSNSANNTNSNENCDSPASQPPPEQNNALSHVPDAPNTIEESNEIINEADTEDDYVLPLRNYKNPELAAQHEQLDSLKSQLSNMKKLLDVAKADRMMEEKKMLERKAELERREAEAQSREDGGVGEDTEHVITGVNGAALRITDDELRDPQVRSKYQQLAEAKKRLSKMEEVMNMIAEAQRNGQSISEALSPEYLAILEDAKNEVNNDEEAEQLQQETVRPSPSPIAIQDVPPSLPVVPSRPIRTAAAARLETENPVASLSRRSERAGSTKSQDHRELSAMERNLDKRTPRVSAVNDGSRIGREKGAIKKHPKAMWHGEDPRVAEALALQEELRQKKNAFEALVRGMGKPTTLNVDNISDNISDNVSESSDRLETTTATWGAATAYSQGRHHRSSDDELLEDDDDTDVAAMLQSQRHSQRRYNYGRSASRGSLPPKDRNRHRPDGPSAIAVNNLGSASSRSVKPKQNKLRGSSVPNSNWERVVQNPRDRSIKSTSNTTLHAHNTLNSAMQQLSQVQDTINSLYETVSNEQNASTSCNNLPNTSLPSKLLPHIPPPTPLLGNYPIHNASSFGSMAPFLATSFTSQGVGGAAAAAAASTSHNNDGNNSGPVLMGLQQCFSQLYLHSLEIQALTKHIQLLDQRENGDVNSSRSRARRNSNEDRNLRDHIDEHYNHNLLLENAGRLDNQSNIRLSSGPPRPQAARVEMDHLPTGVNNSLYSHLPKPRSQSSRHPVPDLESRNSRFNPHQPFENILPMGPNPQEIETMHRYPMDQQQVLDSRHQFRENTDQLPWNSSNPVSSELYQPPPTDLLNNQVPPGTRANNYWDNFRSYSRQNLLSTSTKSNTSENFASVPVATRNPPTSAPLYQGESRRRQGNKHFNLNNQYNNTNHTSQRPAPQAVGGARSKITSTRINNSGNNACLRNPVAGASTSSVQGLNKGKSNNRLVQRPHWQEASRNQNEETETFNPRKLKRNQTGKTIPNVQRNDDVRSAELNVMDEAEMLMKQHSSHPQFLVNLFRHASAITQDTDKQVALDLLRQLSCHRQQEQVQVQNRWHNELDPLNNEIVMEDELSLPAPLRDNGLSAPRQRPLLRHRMDGFTGVSGSEISDSGLTSEDDDDDGHEFVANLNNVSPLFNEPSTPLCPDAFTYPSSQLVLSSNTSHLLTPSTLTTTSQPNHPISKPGGASGFWSNKVVPEQQLDLAPSSPLLHLESSPFVKSDDIAVHPSFDEFMYNETINTASVKTKSSKGEKNGGRLCDREYRKGNRRCPRASNVKSLSQIEKQEISEMDVVLSSIHQSVIKSVDIWQSRDHCQTLSSEMMASLHQCVMREILEYCSVDMSKYVSFINSLDLELTTILDQFLNKDLEAVRANLLNQVSRSILDHHCVYLALYYNDPQSDQSDLSPSNSASQELMHLKEKDSLNMSVSKMQLSQSDAQAHMVIQSQSDRSMATWGPDLTDNDAQTEFRQDHLLKTITSPLDSPVLSASYPESWGHGATAEPVLRTGPIEQNNGNGVLCLSNGTDDWSQDHAEDNSLSDTMEPLLPVHDLAEADQSHDLNEELGEWEDPAVEGLSDVITTRGVLSHQTSNEQGLDEIPTKLQNQQEGAVSLPCQSSVKPTKDTQNHCTDNLTRSVECNGMKNASDKEKENEKDSQLDDIGNANSQQNTESFQEETLKLEPSQGVDSSKGSNG